MAASVNLMKKGPTEQQPSTKVLRISMINVRDRGKIVTLYKKIMSKTFSFLYFLFIHFLQNENNQFRSTVETAHIKPHSFN